MLLNSRCIVSKPASLCYETIAHQPPLQGEAVAHKRDRWGRRRALSLTAPPRTPPRPPEPAIGPATSSRTRWAVDPPPAGEGEASVARLPGAMRRLACPRGVRVTSWAAAAEGRLECGSAHADAAPSPCSVLFCRQAPR